MLSFHQIVEALKILKLDSELYRKYTCPIKIRNKHYLKLQFNEKIQRYTARVYDSEMEIWAECEYIDSHPLNADVVDLWILIRKDELRTEYVHFDSL